MVAAALEWEGTPFRHQHYQKGRGCDCLGLPRGVGMEVIGFDASVNNPLVKPFASYGHQPEPSKLFAALRLFCEEVPKEKAEPGDILVMRLNPGSPPSHVGILLPNSYVIHALASEGKVVRHRMDKRWKEKVVAAFSFRGLE